MHERDFQNFDAFKEETPWIEDDPTSKQKRVRKVIIWCGRD